MSLTEHLRDSGSPVRAYLDGISPVLADARDEGGGSAVAAAALGLVELAESRAVTPPLPGVDRARAGTAIDFRARIALGGFDARESAAALGVAQLPFYVGAVKNGYHRARILREAFDVAVRMLDGPSVDADLDRAALLLAHCEQVHRGGSAALEGAIGAACDLASDGQQFADRLDPSAVADIRSMMESNSAQMDLWREQIAHGDRFEPNPRFAGSVLVGGADADWLVGDTLIDCKAYATLTVPRLRDFLRQLLGYVMLDLDDVLRIRSVGLWLPRQALTRTWTLDQLLGSNLEELLPVLRQGFRDAASGQQLALRVPVTQRRKHQILADNKHTPPRMLIDLAGSEDADIRFRVGRNAMTPEESVRKLARDRYAKVREGAARNERAPVDVLEALSRDRSVVVRRAAAENPRAPKEPLKELGQAPPVSRPRGAKPLPAIETPGVDGAELLTSTEHAVVRIAEGRDDCALDTRWFWELVSLMRGKFGSHIPLPVASQRWAWQLGRSTDAPDWLKRGLTDAVKNDLMSEERPAWLRRTVAGDLPVADPLVRERLLADTDPEIRWSALRRTLDAPHNALGALLSELAASRKERIRFRTQSDDRPNWPRDRTPAEYDKETLRLVACHPSTPLAVLRGLMGTKSADVLTGLIGNPALPPQDLNALLPRLQSLRSVESRERLAALSRIPAPATAILAEDRDVRVRTVLANNPAVPVEVLATLAQDQELSVRTGVLVNRNTPAALAAATAEPLLRSSTDERLLDVLQALDRRDHVALPEELLEDALERLSKSRVRDPDMRQKAARDARTGTRTLERLAQSADESVRWQVASNTRTPPGALKALAADPSVRVRRAAAGNKTLDIGLLHALASDDEPEVRASAATSPRLDPRRLADLLLDDAAAVRSAAMKNPATSPADKARAKAAMERAWWEAAPRRTDLEERVASKHAKVRMKVAFDQRTPKDILALLAGERRSAQVRRAVAANPNAPATVLASLAEDKDAEVRQAVAFNGATPPEVLAELAGRGIDLALLVAMNPDVPTRILDALLMDGDPLVRYVAAGARATRAALSGGDAAGAQTAIGAHTHDPA